MLKNKARDSKYVKFIWSYNFIAKFGNFFSTNLPNEAKHVKFDKKNTQFWTGLPDLVNFVLKVLKIWQKWPNLAINFFTVKYRTKIYLRNIQIILQLFFTFKYLITSFYGIEIPFQYFFQVTSFHLFFSNRWIRDFFLPKIKSPPSLFQPHFTRLT